jgi:hypothetical protein
VVGWGYATAGLALLVVSIKLTGEIGECKNVSAEHFIVPQYKQVANAKQVPGTQK